MNIIGLSNGVNTWWLLFGRLNMKCFIYGVKQPAQLCTHKTDHSGLNCRHLIAAARTRNPGQSVTRLLHTLTHEYLTQRKTVIFLKSSHRFGHIGIESCSIFADLKCSYLHR
ncbi:hypothetical protein CEXT_380951 [Caerostris extrusa]|uniref:SWIM-type domain-containing protein n=1 Tax=Caerostris extrusa TaxID=172846 RepID=A0AAV4N9H8_CAEEX|nr:hypothetical protein CEXT_380951 [Caerostris extrusa]